MSGNGPQVIDVQVGSTAWSSEFVQYLGSHELGERGYRIPVGSSAQGKSLPWRNLDQIIISFNEDVDVQAADLSLSGYAATFFPIVHFAYEIVRETTTPRFIATWTFASPLPKNIYQIDLDGNGLDPVIDLEGNLIDGEWTNNSDVMPSGNGAPGGDFAFIFRVMPGDGNRNNVVETADVAGSTSRVALTTASANYAPFFDIDGSGVHESADAQAIQAYLWSTYPSASPVGVTNDAPTWKIPNLDPAELSNAAIDVAISLWDSFADAETADNQLTYQVVSNSNPSLFDSVSINPTTGNLVLNAASGASGHGVITVRAIDVAGLSVTGTFRANVSYTPVRPILAYTIDSTAQSHTFIFVGYVEDDAPEEGLLVVFTGAVHFRATVQADGWFEFSVIVEEDDVSESVWGDVEDRECALSDPVLGTIGVS